ncbi:MAG: hypothetical protein WBE47_15665 [Candidatus Acidiferrales bacterium]
MATLESLLWIDEEFPARNALGDAFGDCFLNSNNALFSKVRDLFLSQGFRYSSEATRSWRDYNSMSLLMLQDMVDSGVVPYKDNAVTLRRISHRNPGLDMPINCLYTMVQRNYLAHESAHCISYSALRSRFGVSGPSDGKGAYVLLSIVCEAYANTIERLVSSLADSELHAVFFTLNSFLECRPDVCALVRDTIRTLGLPRTFMAGMLTFLYLNTHDENTNETVGNMIVDVTLPECDETDPRRYLLKALINYGFGLNKKFRTETTPVYFRYLGCEEEYHRLCTQPMGVDWLSSTGIFEAVSVLSDLTCRDCPVIGWLDVKTCTRKALSAAAR